MFEQETTAAGARFAALAGAPIAVRSALNRTASAPISPTRGAQVPEEEDRPDWPPPEVEAAMSAEAADREGGGGVGVPSRRAREAAETLDGGPLPSLNEMLSGVSAELQEQLDELFRAKFQTVKRVPAAVLKSFQDERAAGAGGAEDSTTEVESLDPEDDSADD